MNTHQSPVILFDGVCNLCNRTVQFIIKRDKKQYFRFASLQSETGQQLINLYQLPVNLSSFILIENGKAYTRSTGALRVARKLSSTWRFGYIFILIPPFIRNAVYNYIAKHRYKFFGKEETCWLPTPELKHLFLT